MLPLFFKIWFLNENTNDTLLEYLRVSKPILTENFYSELGEHTPFFSISVSGTFFMGHSDIVPPTPHWGRFDLYAHFYL
jgi:hypothetical protein